MSVWPLAVQWPPFPPEANQRPVSTLSTTRMSLNHVSQYSQLTDQHFQAIGELVVEWSNIEFLLRSVLTRQA